jgi:DNA invertase Pin-like site-specific DNA recombinase
MTTQGLLIGYARVSKSDGSQAVDLQVDALRAAGVEESRIYIDKVSGKTSTPHAEIRVKPFT